MCSPGIFLLSIEVTHSLNSSLSSLLMEKTYRIIIFHISHPFAPTELGGAQPLPPLCRAVPERHKPMPERGTERQDRGPSPGNGCPGTVGDRCITKGSPCPCSLEPRDAAALFLSFPQPSAPIPGAAEPLEPLGNTGGSCNYTETSVPPAPGRQQGLNPDLCRTPAQPRHPSHQHCTLLLPPAEPCTPRAGCGGEATSERVWRRCAGGPTLGSAMDLGAEGEQRQKVGAIPIPIPIPGAGASCPSWGQGRLPGGAEQQRQCTASSQFAPA